MGSIRRWFAGLGVMIALGGCGGGGSPSGPAISVQPSDTTATIGSTASFVVEASGAELAYQWQVSPDGGMTWSDAAGATTERHTTAALLPADDGKRYRVVVSAPGTSLVSSAVTLTVTAAPVAPAITVAPASAAVTAPASAVFAVTASGTAPAYQWQRSSDGGASWTGIAGANLAVYDTGATSVAMNGHQLRVIVSNGVGNVTSSAATLTVQSAPVAAAFTMQPSDQSVTSGSAAVFIVAATGAPAPSLQWQRSIDGGTTFANIAAATAATFSTGTTTLSQDGERYRAVATNNAGSTTSTAATLAVNPAPQAPLITVEPTPQAVTAPATASFTAGASGVPTPAWQWQLSTDGGIAFSNIAGATAASYTTPATLPSDDGKRYRAVATNPAGMVSSAAVTLTVRATQPLAIDNSQPLPPTVVNAAYSTTLAATGGTPPYRWGFVGAPPLAVTIDAASGLISGTAPAQEGIYSLLVVVTDSANPPQSNEATVDLAVQAICDHGYGFLQVDGAPPSVRGKLCPDSGIPPGAANANGGVYAAWYQSDPVGRVYEGLVVSFEFGSGRLVGVDYSLNDPRSISSYSCTIPAVPPYYPECAGVTVDPVAGTVIFRNTEIRSGAVQPFILNGSLRY